MSVLFRGVVHELRSFNEYIRAHQIHKVLRRFIEYELAFSEFDGSLRLVVNCKQDRAFQCLVTLEVAILDLYFDTVGGEEDTALLGLVENVGRVCIRENALLVKVEAGAFETYVATIVQSTSLDL